MYIYSNISANLLYVETAEPLGVYHVVDKNGNEVKCPVLRSTEENGKYTATLDASALELKEGVSKEAAEEIKKKFEEVKAVIEIK